MIFKKKEEFRKIPTKNYVIVFVVSLLVIALTFYVRFVYLKYQASNTEGSVFYDKSINQIRLEDLDYAVNEATESILFVSFNGDDIVSGMERRLYREINKKDLNDKILYLNVTDHLVDDKYIDVLKTKFANVSDNINRAPLFIFIKDGEAVEAIDSSSKLADYKAFNTLLSKYGMINI